MWPSSQSACFAAASPLFGALRLALLAWKGDAAEHAAPSHSARSSGSDNLGLNQLCVFKREADPKTCY